MNELVNSALDRFRSAFEADGFGLSIDAVKPEGIVVIQVRHGRDACEDCLIPDDRLALMLKMAIQDVLPEVTAVEIQHSRESGSQQPRRIQGNYPARYRKVF